MLNVPYIDILGVKLCLSWERIRRVQNNVQRTESSMFDVKRKMFQCLPSVNFLFGCFTPHWLDKKFTLDSLFSPGEMVWTEGVS